jgi:hypothetical protein
MKLIRLIKIYLNETHGKVRIGTNLRGAFPIQNGVKQRNALPPLIFNVVLEYASRKVQETHE